MELILLLFFGFLMFNFLSRLSKVKLKLKRKYKSRKVNPVDQGALGEKVINTSAESVLSDEYYVLKNVTLPTKQGTTQIDQVIVSRYGVFVVEVKNLNGWIFGSPRNKAWTQVIYGHKTRFQNPLHQNYAHVKAVEALGVRHIHSLVVFVQNCTFKTEMPENVVYGSQYIRFINSKYKILLSDLEVERVLRLIEENRLPESHETDRKHRENIKRLKESQTIFKH